MAADDERLPAVTLERLLRGRLLRLTSILPRGTYLSLAEWWWRKASAANKRNGLTLSSEYADYRTPHSVGVLSIFPLK
jgi:hypothetical protein